MNDWMKNEKKRMQDYIHFFGGYSCLDLIVAALREACLLLIIYAKTIKRIGQKLKKIIFLEKISIPC